ncbi:MAG: hypothetical protein ABIO29_04460 [Sphingomicrobium sp.]
MTARRLLAGLSLLLLAVAVLANGAIGTWSRAKPELAQSWWPGHPAAELSLAQADIGRQAARGQAPSAATFARLALVAERAPMTIEPLLAAAIKAQQAGQPQRAERLFLIAHQRRPRELASHYFLADSYLRGGKVEVGLRELVELARLAPGGIGSAAPFVADYARRPANWPAMRAVLDRQPALAHGVLLALAKDPDNVPALLALSGGVERRSDASWVETSLAAHIDARRYAEARALWAQFSGGGATKGSLVHDPEFRDDRSPPPFNWALAQSAVGSVERRPGQGIHILFYGSQGGSLVRQLLVLAPGSYRLTTASSGKLAEPKAMSWTITCASTARLLADITITLGGTDRAGFAVPADCPAQWLSLDARAQDIRGDSELRVPFVRIERVGG